MGLLFGVMEHFEISVVVVYLKPLTCVLESGELSSV